MATFLNGVTIGYWSSSSNYMYGTLTGDISRSGNIVYLRNLRLSITSRYSSSGSSSFSFTVYDESFSGRINAPPTSISIPDVWMTVGATQTSKSINWSSSDGYSGSFNISFPSGTSAPSGLAVSVTDRGPDYVTMAVSVSSYGSPATSERYISAILWSKDLSVYGGNPHMETKAMTSTSATLRVDNNSLIVWDRVNITSNTVYSYGAYAYNGAEESRVYHQAGVTTAPAAPAASEFTVVDAGTALFKIKDVSAGSARPVQLQYRCYAEGDTPGQWVNAGSAGNKHTVSVTVTGLDSNTQYNVEVRGDTSSSTTTILSPVATYTNAFKTDKVTVSIDSQSDASSQTPLMMDRTFNVSFSAISDPSTVYEYEYQYKKANESAWSTAVSGTSSSSSTSFVVSLEQSTTYNFRIRARISGGIDEEYGDYTAVQFTTSSYSPGDPYISYRFNDDRSKVYIDVTPSGLVTSIQCVATGGGITLINQQKLTSQEQVTFEADLVNNGSVITPEDVAKFNVTITQRYNSSTRVIESSFNTPWRIIGVITEENGIQKNIIKVRIKTKGGVLTSGDDNHPFVIK